jgi:hypothetical protein
MQALPHNNTLRPQNTATAAGTWCFLLWWCVCSNNTHTYTHTHVKGGGWQHSKDPLLGATPNAAHCCM